MGQAYKIWSEWSNIRVEYQKYLDNLIEKIEKEEKFTFIRISDGEYHLFVFNASWDRKAKPRVINETRKSFI